MIDMIQNIVQPILVELLLTMILLAAGWLMRRLPERMRLDIEARHREALHRALDTGVGLVIDTLQKHPAVAVPDRAVSEIAGYVHRSVPDALRRLAPSQAQLEAMARAKLQERVDAVLGRDRLTEALRRAGADAHLPR